tara:strand:+ start:950 stop:1351 length:402 start_codon:yes stop_codon:yes gene_type:complete
MTNYLNYTGPGSLPHTQRILDPTDYARITTTYDIVTLESAEDGDVAESGWEDEVGHDCRPDDYDRDNGLLTPVHMAVAFLSGKCLDSGGGPETYYEADGHTNMYTGARTRLAFHLVGFLPDELDAIHAFLDLD